MILRIQFKKHFQGEKKQIHLQLHKTTNKDRDSSDQGAATNHTDLSHARLACFLQLIVGGIEGFKQSSDDLFSGLWQVITGCQGIFTRKQNTTF